MAEREDEMRSMMERLERYLGKKLELNAEKTKIMRFRKGGERIGKRLEVEGKKSGGRKRVSIPKVHATKEWRSRGACERKAQEAAEVMDQVRGIGKRRFGKDWGRKLWLFDKLVWLFDSLFNWDGKRERG